MKYPILTLLLLIASLSGSAQQDQFTIGAQLRFRPEFRHGYRTLASDTSKSAAFMGQRSRLIFNYNYNKITVFTSIQDYRVWGDEILKQDIGGLQVNQLWTEIDLNKGCAIKLGRQELAYDDHRLLGNLDWANLTISHDAAVFKYNSSTNKFQWHIGGAFNQASEKLFSTSYGLTNYKALGFTWLKQEFKKGHTLVGMAIVDGHESAVTSSNKLKATYTIGPLYNYKNKGWSGLLGAYYQGGKTKTNLDVNAFMLNAFGQKRMKQFSVGAGYDYLSGDNDKTSATKSNNFNTLYATNHKFYGYMDYFLNIPSDTKQRGLQDVYARFGYYPNNEWSAHLDVHNFSLANPNKSMGLSTKIGNEADFVVNYNPSPLISLQGGFSMMLADNNLELIKGGIADEMQGWAFFILKVSPNLFTHNFKH